MVRLATANGQTISNRSNTVSIVSDITSVRLKIE